MMQVTLCDALWTPTRPMVRNTILVLGGSVLIALSAHIRVPIGPVPFTMQTFAILSIGLAYGPRLALSTVVTYLVEGLIGLPVFTGGPATLIGPTAGYLVGFLPAAALVGVLASRGWSRPWAGVLLAMVLGSAVIYAFGASWLATFVGVEQAFALGVAPFLIGDALKAALAASLFSALWRVKDRP